MPSGEKQILLAQQWLGCSTSQCLYPQVAGRSALGPKQISVLIAALNFITEKNDTGGRMLLDN